MITYSLTKISGHTNASVVFPFQYSRIMEDLFVPHADDGNEWGNNHRGGCLHFTKLLGWKRATRPSRPAPSRWGGMVQRYYVLTSNATRQGGRRRGVIRVLCLQPGGR